MKPAQMKKGFAPILIVVLILGITTIAASGFYFVQKYSIENQDWVNDMVPVKSPSSQSTDDSSSEASAKDKTVQSDEGTSNWKTYTNKEVGFTFKYPKEWDYQVQNYTASILKPGIREETINLGIWEDKDPAGDKVPAYIPPAYVVLDIVGYQNPIPEEFSAYLDENVASGGIWSDVKINGIAAKRVEHTGCQSGNCVDILIIKNNVIIDFSAQNGDAELNQILSTFKFLE